ncbi:Dolichyl phosphate glucosyltransferase [hydrothermal vent metagenome]|uniref:dolichyl-phosphate beta-glucosyltransferase n=1 Tax=hydrothermal vent metagenome TaxID=652676 RepID=A0A3B1BWY3_9ZZZZ
MGAQNSVGFMRKTALVIPCFNEAERLQGEKFVEALAKNQSLNLIFVNDGSSDGTGRKLADICENFPARSSVIELETNSGKAEAVRRGVLKAIEERFDYIGYLDADLATPFAEIEKIEAELEEKNADLVLGSRVKLLGRNIRRKLARHLVGRVLATFISLALNLPVYDTQCGAKLFRNCDIIFKVFKEPFLTGWLFDVELIARFIIANKASGKMKESHFSIIEKPLDEWVDVQGSKVKFSHLPSIVKDMATLVYRYTPALYRKT